LERKNPATFKDFWVAFCLAATDTDTVHIFTSTAVQKVHCPKQSSKAIINWIRFMMWDAQLNTTSFF